MLGMHMNQVIGPEIETAQLGRDGRGAIIGSHFHSELEGAQGVRARHPHFDGDHDGRANTGGEVARHSNHTRLQIRKEKRFAHFRTRGVTGLKGAGGKEHVVGSVNDIEVAVRQILNRRADGWSERSRRSYTRSPRCPY